MSDTLIDVPPFSDGVIPDVAAVTPPELACEVCGKELIYGGRGRKPKRCDEHRKSPGTKRANMGQNTALAGQAAEALCQINGLAALGLMVARLPVTAETLQNAQEGFREQAYNALLTDPALCKTILKGGTASGKIALLIAYGMMGAAVAPAGIIEVKLRAAERAAAKEAELEAAAQ